MQIGEWFASKKAKAFMTGLIILVGAYIGLDDATASALADRIVALAGLYIAGQSAVDHGKSKAK